MLVAFGLLFGVGPGSAVPGANAAAGCKQSYAYAGVQDAKVHHGIRATIDPLMPPDTSGGFVASWVGVGGPGLGPDGTDEWLQAGFAKFQSGPMQVYYEVTRPGQLPAYHAVRDAVSEDQPHRIAVLATNGDPNSWQVWLDDEPVSPPIELKASAGRFRPQVQAETNNSDGTRCNAYAWRFTKIEVAQKAGGSWGPTKAGYVFRDKYNAATKTSKGSFDARSLSSAAPREPSLPLLALIASRLTGKRLTAECARQEQPVRAGPDGQLILSNRLCEKLLGYTIAQPYTPAAAALQLRFAVYTLDFLRGVGSAVGVKENLDCRAVAWIRETLRLIGVTNQQGRALRTDLLRNRPALRRKLAGC